MERTRIVVGVDGSAGCLPAVRWAATEALGRRAELRVLAAYHRRPPGGVTEQTAAAVHEAVTQARAAAPGVEVRGVALPGYAVPVLVHAGEDAALLVVGCRHGGGLPGMPSGSVGGQVATHARCSVVVVRGRPGADGGPVVAGVADDDTAGTVLARAFEEAALRSAPLVAVTVGAAGGDDGVLARWRDKFPEIAAERRVVGGRPDRVLEQQSREAQLVVVGPRRHGFEGVLLGAAGTRLVERADCPVMIARP